MASLPPPPINEPPGSFVWLEWYKLLRNYITVNGSVPWNIINFAGSNLADIATKSHLSLQAVQGGSAGEQYHLTSAQHSGLTGGSNTTLHLHQPVLEYSAPITGFTSTIGNTTNNYIIDPAGTLASGTLNMPASPSNGQEVCIATTQIITALTHNGNGATLKAPLTTTTVNGYATWVYRTTNTTWYRIN